MAEFEEKLNSILGNQQAMGQIMSLARSLSGDSGHSGGEDSSASGQQEDYSGQPSPFSQIESTAMPDFSQLLGNLDPKLIQMGMRLFQEYQGSEDRNTALLAALRPFLREERREKLDQALQMVRVTKLIRVALSAMGGKGEDANV